MSALRPFLKDADAAAFLADDWQRRPRFFSGALTTPPALPHDWRELCEDPTIESRQIVTRDGPAYEVIGADQDVTAHPWTVLIQSIDTHVPALRALYDTVDFLPRWRLEDIMVSVASPGGSVGPHVDRYDVFLVQAQGERRWDIGVAGQGVADPSAADLRLVEPFEPALTVVAKPGDVLYLPPDVPHHGVALDGPAELCATFSIGFRAPSLQDLAAVALSDLHDAPLLSDVGRGRSTDVHALDAATLTALARQLKALFDDQRLLAHALGELVTEPLMWPESDGDDALPPLTAGDTLVLKATSRVAHVEEQWLYANGQRYPLADDRDRALARALMAARRAGAETVAAAPALAARLFDDAVVERPTP